MTPGPVLRTTVDRAGHSVVVRASGELDIATGPVLLGAVVDAGPPGPVELVVDLSDVTFVDAAGLTSLLQCAEVVRSGGGRLCLSSPSHMLRRMLRLLELEDRLPVAQNSVGVAGSRPRSSS